MEEYIKKTQKYSILVSIAFLIIGIFLITNPVNFLSIVATFFGVIILGIGLAKIIAYFMSNFKEFEFFEYKIIEGILEICFGIFCIFKPSIIVSIFPIIIGVFIVLQSIRKFQIALNLKKFFEKGWLMVFLSGLLSIILGMIIICNPFKTTLAVISLGGIILVINQIINIIDSIVILVKIK